MHTEFVQLTPQAWIEDDIGADPDLEELLHAQQGLESLSPISARRGHEDQDQSLDLRVNRPRAIDLRKLWKLTGQQVPSEIAAALGPRIPVLLNHVVTPFPADGHAPGGVWGLGYEIVAHDIDANTVSVIPSDETLEIGKVGQKIDLGIELGGRIGVPDSELQRSTRVSGISLTGASLHASTNQQFQFALEMRITLRKVVGAGVGIGGALWKLYRQNEPIDQPHVLLQTLLVPEGTQTFRCSIKTWARRAGLFGTRLGARFSKYPEQQFDISLTGL